MSQYRRFEATVAGGELVGGEWNPLAPGTPVFAVHGITASHLAWRAVADRLEGTRVIAPDLRGRGRSNALPAPWGIRDHADDVVRVLDALEVDSAVVIGHSMGGFVAVRLAAAHPDRVAHVVLVDGGLPLPSTPGTPDTGDALALLGPAADRLTKLFPTREAYADFWRAHPAFSDWNDDIAAYVDYDLEPAGDGFRSSSRVEAVATNIVQLGAGDGYLEALAALPGTIDFLHAPRGLLNEIPPLYPADRMAEHTTTFPALRIHEIDDVNHYTILMSEHGAAQVVRVLREFEGVNS
jgi:pimeloyl-ACP methyl ester carboxylesterase